MLPAMQEPVAHYDRLSTHQQAIDNAKSIEAAIFRYAVKLDPSLFK
jgi:hypothetical protein